MKKTPSFLAAALALSCGAMLLTGCQATPTDFDRALEVTPLPTSTTSTPNNTAKPKDITAPSAGVDLHLGSLRFGLNCSTDTAGSTGHGIAAVMCSWDTQPH